MQVKKFEAKTMKEALELVKVHLGPEAIILSAKDTHRGFGLMGDKSVEVTAAVSEETLRRKHLAETKLREEMRTRFQQIPAARQKQFIDRVFGDTQARRETVAANEAFVTETRAQSKGMRYIDIADDEMPASRPHAPSRPAPVATEPPRRSARVSAAAAAAATAARATFTAPPAQASIAAAMSAPAAKSNEVRALENQVAELKAIVEKFAQVPQIPMTMHPGAEQGLSFELSGLYQRLTGQGVQPQIATGMLRKATKELDADTLKKPALVDAWAVKRMLDNVEVAAQPTASRYHVFVGSTGQGKTTTLVKFASHLMLKEKRTIAIISLDTIKLGAAEQLRLYAQILNVPFAIVRSPEEWQVAERKLGGVQHILVDCPGFSLRREEEIEWLRRMIPPASLSRSVHFVQSVLARDEETLDIATRYHQTLSFNDVIFTRLDESSRFGGIVNFQDRFKVPLHSFAFGTRIPEDYEFASKERVVELLFKLGKINRREEAP